MFKSVDKPMDLNVKTSLGDDDFDDLWNQDKVTTWLNENGWPHIASVFQDRNICGERFFHITLAELVQLLPRRITTYADRRRLLNDIRALGVSCNQMKTGSTDISINTNLQSFPIALNSSDNQSSSLPSVGTPTSGHMPTSNSPATPSSASRTTDYCGYSDTPTTATPTVNSIEHTQQQTHQQHQRSQYQCHSRHGSDLSSSSTNHHYFYYNNNASSPSTSEFPAPSSKYYPNNNNKQHQSPTKSSYSPKSAFTKFRNSFLSRTNINSSDPSSTNESNFSASHQHRRHLSPINTNLGDISSQQQISPPLISPRVSSMNYDSNILQQKSARDEQQQPSIPTRISATPDKVSKFWATYSHFLGSNNETPASAPASSVYQQDPAGTSNHPSPSRYQQQHSNNNNNISLGVVSSTAISNSPQKKADQRIQITGDKETWYSLNVKHIQCVDQLKDHILKRMNLSGDHGQYRFFHENGENSGIPLDDQALMYLCAIADHSASDRILVTQSSNQVGGSIYKLSTYAMSTPELGHSPLDLSASSSPCTHKTPHTSTMKTSTARVTQRPRPLCRHTASASRLKLDGPPPAIGVQLSDPPLPYSPTALHNSDYQQTSTAPSPPPLNYHQKPPSSSNTTPNMTTGLWAIPPKRNQTMDCTSSSSRALNTYPGAPQHANMTSMETYVPPTETEPSPPFSFLSSNSPPRLGHGNNSDISLSPATAGDDYDDADQLFWGERPPAEVVCQNMDKYFDDHDLDKEVVIASADVTGSQQENTTPHIPFSHQYYHQNQELPCPQKPATGLRRHTKSIRVLAREASKKYISRRHRQVDNPATITTPPTTNTPTSPPPSTTKKPAKVTGSTMMRRKSTKLWGQRVVEVKPKGRSYGKEQQISMSHHQHQKDNTPHQHSDGGDVQWIRGKLIGKGSFGRVYLAFNVVSGEVIAVKQVEIPRTKSDRLDVHQNDMVEALYREIAMLRDLDHETIVQYLGYGVDEQEAVVNIFLEYVAGGNIASRLAVQGAFDEPLVRHFTRQVCQGLAYLHSRHILHRDIKAANILVEADGVCKISDFGLSKKNDYAEVYDQNSRMSLRGSVYWMAPEVVKNEPYSAKVDIWSLGCTVIEMFTGQRPWMTFNQIATLYNLGHHNAPDMPEHASDVAKDFLQKCFTIDPNYRPTALELLDHPFCAFNPAFQFKDYVDKGKV